MTFKERKALSMNAYPLPSLPNTVAGRQEFLDRLMNFPVYDDEGNDTGETCQLISRETYLCLTKPVGVR